MAWLRDHSSQSQLYLGFRRIQNVDTNYIACRKASPCCEYPSCSREKDCQVILGHWDQIELGALRQVAMGRNFWRLVQVDFNLSAQLGGVRRGCRVRHHCGSQDSIPDKSLWDDSKKRKAALCVLWFVWHGRGWTNAAASSQHASMSSNDGHWHIFT